MLVTVEYLVFSLLDVTNGCNLIAASNVFQTVGKNTASADFNGKTQLTSVGSEFNLLTQYFKTQNLPEANSPPEEKKNNNKKIEQEGKIHFFPSS